MNKLSFEFNKEQVNTILGALVKMPYEAVVNLIPHVIKQAQDQVNPDGTRTVGPPPSEKNKKIN
jgi:hypothetical protein